MKATFFAIYIFINLKLSAQLPDLIWNMSYGGTAYDRGSSVVPLGNNFVVLGNSNSIDGDLEFNEGFDDFFLVKINSSNELVFSKTYGGSNIENGNCITKAYGGGLTLGGSSYSNDGVIPGNYGSMDAILLKTDSLGNLDWIHHFGGSDADEINSVIKTPDSGYIFTGRSFSTDFDITDHLGTSEYSDVIVGKTDSLGNLMWLKSYGSSFSDGASEIIRTKDSCYIICGYRNFDFADYYILKITSDGTIVWEKTYGGSEFDQANSIYELNSGNIIVCGEANSNDEDITSAHGGSDNWVIYLNPEGELIWQRAYGGSIADIGYKIFECSDLSILIAGSSTTPDNGDIIGHHGAPPNGDYWVLKIDNTGVIKWSNCYGGDNSEYGYGAAELMDSSYVVVGFSWSNDGDVDGHHEAADENTDMWAIKLKESCIQEKYYHDFDSDLFGNESIYIYSCTDTVGYVLNNLDCIDENPFVNPSVTIDLCNTIDDNCNGLIDENATFEMFYVDADGDGFGNIEIDSISCADVAGYVSGSTDCNDADSSIYPAASELLNGIDDNCNNLIDEGLGLITSAINVIKIYPNPTKTYVTISYQDPSKEYSIIIYTITGDVINKYESVFGEIIINLSGLSSGVYLIETSVDFDKEYYYLIKD